MLRRHKFTYERVNGLGSLADTPGIRYQCSCGWSHGWIANASVRKARRINRIAHRVMRLRERAQELGLR